MSIIETLLKPYKILFKGSKEEPKEAGVQLENEQPEEKTVEETHSEPKPVAPPDNRAGKVLWKKK